MWGKFRNGIGEKWTIFYTINFFDSHTSRGTPIVINVKVQDEDHAEVVATTMVDNSIASSCLLVGAVFVMGGAAKFQLYLFSSSGASAGELSANFYCVP
jgi:hypothetical protein